MNVKEAAELVELGFEYVTGEYDDGGKLFKKESVIFTVVVHPWGVVV
jgi:hypothetical protein